MLFLVDHEGLEGGYAALRKEYLELYRQARARGRHVPGPRQVLLELPSLLEHHPRRVQLHGLKGGPSSDGRLRLPSEPPRSFFGNLAFLREELANLLAVGYRITIFAEYEQQAERRPRDAEGPAGGGAALRHLGRASACPG